jgi:hypothetical protein
VKVRERKKKLFKNGRRRRREGELKKMDKEEGE